MPSQPLPSLRVLDGVGRGTGFKISFEGNEIEAFPGETIAAALLASGVRGLRRTEKRNSPRGVFCGMGICFDCLVTVDGRPHQRACLAVVEPGMRVTLQDESAWRRSRA